MTDNFMLYLIKQYFKVYLYLAGNFGIFCFTAQGVAALTETPGLAPNYERVMTDEAVFTATEYNTATEVTTLQKHTELMAASIEQVTSVSQLTDVQSTDWAFQALQSLVERYDAPLATTGETPRRQSSQRGGPLHGAGSATQWLLMAGYPDSAYRGHQAITRYEFAAGLSVVLERVNELIRTGVANQVSRNDLVTLQRLQAEFAAELATLQNRVDTLEVSAATLEANQFSTTTKLTGQAIFAVTGGGFSGERIIAPTGVEIANTNPNSTFIYRTSLNFNTSFQGTDLLQIRLTAGSDGSDDNAAGLLEPNFGSVLDFSVPGRNNKIGLGRLFYTFTPAEDFMLTLGSAILATDYVDLNSYANDSVLDFSTQALINNFVLLPTPAGAGAVIDWNPGEGPFTLRAVYVAGNAENPVGANNATAQGFIGGPSAPQLIFPTNEDEGGLFGDPYQGLIEAEYSLDKVFAFRLQYSHGTIFGSRFDVFGANFELSLSQQLAAFGRYGYGIYDDSSVGDLRPQYWMAGISFRDLFVTGALAGIAAGQPLIEGGVGSATQTNFEAFYNLPLNDNIRITPLVQVILDSGNQGSNGTIVTGTLRTVLSF